MSKWEYVSIIVFAELHYFFEQNAVLFVISYDLEG